MCQNPWILYKNVESCLLAKEEVQNIIENLTSSGCSRVDLEPINSYLAEYNCTLQDAFAKIYSHIISQDPEHELVEFNYKATFALLYANLHNGDTAVPGDSVVLQSTYIFFSCIERQTEALLELDKTCLSVYKLCIEKLTGRYNSGHEIGTVFLCDFNRFLQNERLNVEAVKVTIDFLILFGSHHFDMIQTLSMFNDKCTLGFLSFVCLSTLIYKEYRDKGYDDPKQIVIIYLFNSIIRCLNQSVGLTEVQVGILHSNFRSLIRQTTFSMGTTENSIPFAIIRLSPFYADSKVLALLINQLHFDLYSIFIKLLVRITKSKYDVNRQKMCLNLLESPYIIYNEDLKGDHLKIIKSLLEALIWPIKSDNEAAVHTTIPLINKIFYLQDKDTIKVFIDIISNNPNYSMGYIMNFIYENCSVFWDSPKKQLNQYFISILCNLFLLTHGVPENSYRQFEHLINSADLQDLVPCIPILKEVVQSSFESNTAMFSIIANTLVSNALSPNLHNSCYVQALYDLLFLRGSVGYKVAKSLFAYGYNIQALVDRMRVQKHIKIQVFKHLSIELLNGEDCLMLLEIITHLFNDVTLPSQFFDYWEKKSRNDDLFIGGEIKLICSILSRLIHGKKTILPHEKEGFVSFVNFIETNLPKRKFAICVLRSILVAYRTIVVTFNMPLTKMKNLFTVLEEKMENLHNYITEEKQQAIEAHLVLRDMTYYAEICAVFGEKQDFCIKESIVTSIITCLNVISKDDCYFDEVVEAVLKCATVLSIRNNNIMVSTDYILKKVVLGKNCKYKITALYCMFDIATSQTQNFDPLIPYICEFMNSNNSDLQAYGLKLFIKLVDKEYVVPNNLHIFAIAHLISKNSLRGKMSEVEMENVLSKLTKLFEKYFINILLYFNQYYSYPGYSLTATNMKNIPTSKVTFENRVCVYSLVLKIFPFSAQRKILNYVYTEIVKNIFLSTLNYPKNYEIIQDIISISFAVLKRGQQIYVKDNKPAYERTISKIERIKSDTFRKSSAEELDYDDVIKNVVKYHLKLLTSMDNTIKHIIPEIFHLLLAVFQWYYGSICNSMLNEKRESEFCKLVYTLPRLYKANKNLIHFEKQIELEPTQSTSGFHRV